MYWRLNLFIVFGAIYYALKIWHGKRRILAAVLAVTGGMLWQCSIGAYRYLNKTCATTGDTEDLFALANQCIPIDDQTIWAAQMFVLGGVIVLVVELFFYYTRTK